MESVANSVTNLPTSQPHFVGIAARILALAACLILEPILHPVGAACPTLCSCSATNVGGEAVSCGPGLVGFPQGLPADAASISLSPQPSQAPNNIPVLQATDVQVFKDLTWLTIRRSKIRQISPSAFATLTKLLGLDLRDNKIQRLSRSNLVGLSSLITLDISDNGGCLLDSNAFKDIPQLRILRIANIGLDVIGQMLRDMTSLTHLDLHGNNLFRLHGSSLASLKNLRHLDLSGNDLYGIDEDAEPVLSSLAALDLDSNPWRCNCAFTWVKSLPRKFVAPHGGGRMPVVCSQPSRLSFLNVWDVQGPQMTCSAAAISSCTGPVTVWAGDQISITCDVEGDPFPDVFWYRPDGTQVQSDVTFATADTSTLVGITADRSVHHGLWRVRVVSYNTTATKTVQVTVLTVTTQSSTTTITPTTGSSSQHAGTTRVHSSNNNNSLQFISSTTLSPQSVPFISPGGRPISNLVPSSISPGSKGSNGNNAIVSTPSGTGLGQLSTTRIPGSGPGGGNTNNNDNSKSTKNNSNKNNNNSNSNNNNDKNDNRFNSSNNNNNSNNSSIDHNIIVLVAILSGTVVCIVGMTLFALTVYKIRQKRQIHARRRRRSADLYR
ncbi:hypothetical protein EGW08_014275 [Elysia chlorotica]|uniref:Ig-like domain-containing protein n=1 Tax=Elysia chlorotica TaxID=188477 RepID=A0A3S1HEW8_ELYCH|nr:hypothetical protein EGW08_014275 [Elysia chlorotica]